MFRIYDHQRTFIFLIRFTTYLFILLAETLPLTAQSLYQIGVLPLQIFTPSEYHNQGKIGISTLLQTDFFT